MLLGLFCRFAGALHVLGVYVLDTLTRTAFKALQAVNTLAVVDDRHVVYKVNCTTGAITFAFAASNTARLTLAHYVLASALRGASNVYLSRYRNTGNELLGACLDTNSATTAQIGVDVCVTFTALYRHVGTCVNTTSATHTTYLTSLTSACK